VTAALTSVDVVGKGVDRLLVGGVPLHRDLDRALLGFAGEEDHLAVDCLLVLVQVGDEVLDPALVLKLLGVALAALVHDRDLQTASQESCLTQPLFECAEVKLQRLENIGVREEGDGGPGWAVRGQLLATLELVLWRAARVLLPEGVSVAANLHAKHL
jgi:hypothetical protein